jgi:hypothetical protein
LVKLGVKKNNLFKAIGLIGALFIVVFGNIGNFLRTLKVTVNGKNKKSKK